MIKLGLFSFSAQRCMQSIKRILFVCSFLSFQLFASNNLQFESVLEEARHYHRHSKDKPLLALVEPLMAGGEFMGRDKLEVLNMVITAYIAQGDLDKAAELNRQLQLEALYLEDNLYIGRALINEGEMLQSRGLNAEALQKHRQALTYYRKTPNKKFIANALLEISYSLGDLNLNIEALNYAQQSLAMGEEIEDLLTIASAYNSIGMIHDSLGNYEEALSALQKTIELDRQRGELDELATSYFNVANTYIKIEDYEQARFYVEEALKLDIASENPDFLAHDYEMLARLSLFAGDYQEAIDLALKANEYLEQLDSVGKPGSTFNILAKAWYLFGDEAKSEEYLTSAISLNSQTENGRQLTRSHITQIEILIDKKQIPEALALIEKTLKFPLENKYFDHIRALFMLKSQAYETSGEYESALAAYKDYYQLKDDYESQNRTIILAQLQNQMDFLHKEHQIELLESKSAIRQLELESAKLEKNLWIVGLALCVLLVAAFFYRERTKREVSAMEKQLLAESIEQKNAMLAEVAHELRSPITALKLQVESLQYNLEDDPESAYQRLDNKVAELNQLIEDLYYLARADNGLLKLNMESVSVQDLVEDITDGYQEVVEHKGLELKTELQVKDSDYFTVDTLRIKQVIVNLIRNSINYTNSPGVISCTARSNDKGCEIILEDSAPAVPTEEIPRLFERMYRADGTRDKDQSGSGLGLSICKSLVEAHNGKIRASTSQLGGLRVKISLPMDKDDVVGVV